MSSKINKYIEFLKNPTNYINNEKSICTAANSLIDEINAMMILIDETTRDQINNIFPQIKHIKCATNIAALLGNTQYNDINQIAQLLIAKYLFILKLLVPMENIEKVNCDNIKDIIDTAVNNISLEKALSTNNIFSNNPIYYKKHNNPAHNDQNLVSSCLSDLPYLAIFSDRDLEKIPASNVGEKELFNQKKKFADEVTKAMSDTILFNDIHQDIINNFQYLINKMFNDKISEYIKSKGYSNDSIYFIYKGGTTMKIIYDKYKHILPNNNKLFTDNAQYFSRSDSDYGIFINKGVFSTPELYNQVLCDINKISFNLLILIRDIISNNSECICPVDNISDDKLKNLLDKLNSVLNVPDRNISLPNFNDIKEFIGISFSNKDYFTKPIPRGLSNKYLHDRRILITKTDSGSKSMSEFDKDEEKKKLEFKRIGKIKPVRDDFIIRLHNSNVPGQPMFSPAICETNNPTNKKGIYYYYNETNKFYQDVNLTEFNLHRLKINTVVYYVTYTGQYGFFNCPSELVDISISNFYDMKIQNISLSKMLKKYKNNKLEYYSYSLYGFIDDLMKGIFNEGKYPWKTNKYNKKVYRLTIFLFIYINNKFNNSSVIYSTLIKFLNDLTNNIVTSIDTFQLEELSTKIKYPITNDELIYKLYSGILKRYNLIQGESSRKEIDDEMGHFKEFIKIITSMLGDVKPEIVASGYNDNIETVPFLEKYLKYKNKYNMLKNKLLNKIR